MNCFLKFRIIRYIFCCFLFADCGGGVGNVEVSAGGLLMGQDSRNGGAGSGSDSGETMDADTRARELARRKEEARRKRRKKKRTGSSLVSSCFQGK